MMRIKIKENMVTGLGNSAVPGNYNTPDFGVGTAIQPGSPNPDAQLAADSAGITPNGIDPLNKGYQLGGAYDPLAEFEPASNNPAGMSIGGGDPSRPISSPGFPAMASGSFQEDGIGMEPDGMPVGFEAEDFFDEDNPFEEDSVDQTFDTIDAVPAFEDIEDDPALAALTVDADGIIQPIVVPDEIIVEPELGEIPDAALPFEEPILDITEDDVEIPENVFENDGMPEVIPVVESFKLPENQNVIVSKGDRIFVLGRVREEFTPKFAESVFSRALKSLIESKGQSAGVIFKIGQKHEKVAVIGRSMLVEVAKDWMLPGTGTIFEARDLLQIVSPKPIREAEETDEANDESGKDADKAEKFKKRNEKENEIEKAKKEALMAYRRWKEASNKRKEDDDSDDDDDLEDDSEEEDDKAEKKAKKERAKREAALLERYRTGGLI